MNKVLTVLIAASGLLAAGDISSIRGPVSGHLYDPQSRSLRVVVGVPGASWLSASLLTDAASASVAPDGSTALVVSGDRLLLITQLRGNPVLRDLNGTMPGADRFAWSKTAAAQYSSTRGQAQILRNVFQSPEADLPLDLSSLPGTVSAIALAGDSLAIAVDSETGGGIYLAQRGSPPRLLASAGSARSLVIAASDLFYADRESGTIWHIPDFPRNSTPVLFLSGIQDPVGLALDGGRLLVVAASSRKLLVFDIASRATAAEIDLEFEPSGLEPAGMPSQWLLAKGIPGRQPYYLLDTSQTPAVYFVPAAEVEQ
ncbi:MAG: hypothetical protein HY820_06710 [Acidobacteria bacterium]|nr:hypothetical protein [Acidobacteriota bacterium]